MLNFSHDELTTQTWIYCPFSVAIIFFSYSRLCGFKAATVRLNAIKKVYSVKNLFNLALIQQTNKRYNNKNNLD